VSASKQQKLEWYHRNKQRLALARYEKKRNKQLTDEERLAYEWSLAPFVEAFPYRIEQEEGYTFLDFLLESETV